METISNKVALKGLTIVGKVALPAKKRKPFIISGGATIGEMLKAKGVTLQ